MDLARHRTFALVLHVLLSLGMIAFMGILYVISGSFIVCGANESNTVAPICAELFFIAASVLVPTGVLPVLSLLFPNKITTVYLWGYSVFVGIVSFPLGTIVAWVTVMYLLALKGEQSDEHSRHTLSVATNLSGSEGEV